MKWQSCNFKVIFFSERYKLKNEITFYIYLTLKKQQMSLAYKILWLNRFMLGESSKIAFDW